MRKRLCTLTYETNAMKRRMNTLRRLAGPLLADDDHPAIWGNYGPTPPPYDPEQPEEVQDVQAFLADTFMGVSGDSDWDSAGELQPLLQEQQPPSLDQSKDQSKDLAMD